MSFKLNNDTVLRGYLSHVHSNIRKRSQLLVEYIEHPDNVDRKVPESPHVTAIREGWEQVVTDVQKVLGVELKPWHQLVTAGSFEVRPDTYQTGARDALRITMRVLKQRCDKARRKDPTIKLMKSWDITTRESTEEDEA